MVAATRYHHSCYGRARFTAAGLSKTCKLPNVFRYLGVSRRLCSRSQRLRKCTARMCTVTPVPWFLPGVLGEIHAPPNSSSSLVRASRSQPPSALHLQSATHRYRAAMVRIPGVFCLTWRPCQSYYVAEARLRHSAADLDAAIKDIITAGKTRQ